MIVVVMVMFWSIPTSIECIVGHALYKLLVTCLCFCCCCLVFLLARLLTSDVTVRDTRITPCILRTEDLQKNSVWVCFSFYLLLLLPAPIEKLLL